jgi:hypothetical protein
MSDMTYIAGSDGGFTFTGDGTGNTLDLPASTTLLTINVPGGELTGLSGSITTDYFSDIQTFEGNFGSGGTTFIAGSIGGFTFVGEGAGGGNTLDFSDASSGVSIFLTPNSQGEEVAQTGSGSDTFTDITIIEGSAAGGNTFFGGPGDYTLEGGGSNNTLDFGTSSAGVAFSVSDGSGSAAPESGGDTTFSDIQIFEGSTAGGNVFTVGAGSQTLEGGGSNNELTFAADPAGIEINTATGTAVTSTGTDTFSDIQTFVGSSSGSNTFIVGSGSYTFESGGSGNTIVYTPQSHDVTTLYSPASELLDFQGFGNSLDAQDVQNDATISNGNTYINIPDAGMITLLGYTGGIWPSDMEFTACYSRGTLIATETSEVPVEDLAIGDYVMTKSGTARPIKWIGRRLLDTRRHPDPTSVWPVCVSAGAFGENKPSRDLWLSPGHNIAAEGVLMPIKALQNSKTIVQHERSTVEYWHVELDQHDIIFAEGLPAESYLDTGNRSAFINGGAFIEAHPDFKPKHWAATCVPLIKQGPEVVRTKTLLLERLKAFGHVTTSEAEPHVIADGTRIEPIELGAMRFAFTLPPACSDIRLMSRTFIPAHSCAASTDTRPLGICVKRLQIDGEDIPLDDQSVLGHGWNDLERHPSVNDQRWTVGNTPMPANARLIVIDLVGPGHYWQEPEDNVVALFG